jgi:tetraacyldisaccharide 4'-kinase
MRRPPAFWRHGVRSVWPALLAPIGAVVAAVTARRIASPGWRAPVPVICCGNVTVGGAGKTTLALDLANRLRARGVAVHVLLRGYGGTSRGVRHVAPGDPVSLVGDEALLLAEIAPTWVGADRAASARAAVAAGAQALLLDDGLQNPSLAKDLSLLVVDGGGGFGNGHVLPAGPLREPVAAGAARCQAAVLIGADETGAVARLPSELPLLPARLEQGPEIAGLLGQRAFAFAGIARPEKFFDGLEQAGVTIVARRPFSDHHPYTAPEIQDVLETATRLDAIAVTTPKDAVRLQPALRAGVRVVGVRLVWDDEAVIENLLDGQITSRDRPTHRQ